MEDNPCLLTALCSDNTDVTCFYWLLNPEGVRNTLALSRIYHSHPRENICQWFTDFVIHCPKQASLKEHFIF